jgi:hypothetical protein
MAYHGEEEALRAGRRTLAVWALTSLGLLILGILFATGTITGSKAPAPPKPAGSEAPAGTPSEAPGGTPSEGPANTPNP